MELKKQIKFVAYSSQGSHTSQLDWQMGFDGIQCVITIIIIHATNSLTKQSFEGHYLINECYLHAHLLEDRCE